MKKISFLLTVIVSAALLHSCRFPWGKSVESLDGRIVLDADAANVSGIDDFNTGDTVVLEIAKITDYGCMEAPFSLYQVKKDSSYRDVYGEETFISHGMGEHDCPGREDREYHRSIIRTYSR